MSTFSRYLRHPAPGTTGVNGLAAANNPYDAGRATFLRNNAKHLVEVNYRRTLWTSAGVEGFYRAAQGAAQGGTSFVDPPGVNDIRWQHTRKTGGLALDLGTTFVWHIPGGRLPRLVARFQVKVASTYTVGIVLGAAPGQTGPLQSRTVVSATYTHTAFTEVELAANLTEDSLAPLDFSGADGTTVNASDENGRLMVFRAFLGGYCSSNSGSATASVVGLSLGLEPPT